ncbi:MAG: aspartate/glutamate racemase family protein [Chitinophagaceae bacterium]
MKTIGLVGGLTWHSTIEYYRIINETVYERAGGDEAAKIILNSVNYGEIKKLTHAGDWKSISSIICFAARQTEIAGADCMLLGANTMHHIAGEVQSVINIPLIHIADATAKQIQTYNLKTVALLGTKYTMKFDFFKNRLAAFNINTMIPDDEDVETINSSIYNELGKGIFLQETKQKYLTIINKLIGEEAGGVILGCTRIPLLIQQQDVSVPVFDTTFIHATAAVDFALE